MADQVKVFTFFGEDVFMLADQVKDIIKRGGVVRSLSIAYGPAPNRARETWHAMAVVDVSGIDPDV